MALKEKTNPELDEAAELNALSKKLSAWRCDPFVSPLVPPFAKSRGMYAPTRKETTPRCSVAALPRNKRALLWGCYKRVVCAKPFGSGGFSR